MAAAGTLHQPLSMHGLASRSPLQDHEVLADSRALKHRADWDVARDSGMAGTCAEADDRKTMTLAPKQKRGKEGGSATLLAFISVASRALRYCGRRWPAVTQNS
jgi:hypothetical protein